MYNMTFLKKYLYNLAAMGAGGAGVYALLSLPLPYLQYALIGITVFAALYIVFFITQMQIENAEREKRWAERELERKADYARLRSEG